ncbi:TBC-domain-containing protein [Piedraia hortae CBS 480.64]|uniref:TBC-domain-containing protein n=1 Tax=Piedraia hortae CBS 480.64 TaxID=1314780 RepID=A0A6A7BSM1_9PEZI|nr:TBC-domain-containing protein [Piedraia hortae CBS 480.64]
MVQPSQDETTFVSFPKAEFADSPESQRQGGQLNLLLDRSEPSMFDETNVDAVNDPQTLSTASAEVIQHVVDHHGVVSLIRRLAALLAERDAHVTALTRLAEDHGVPRSRIAETSSRVRQAEQRRLALQTAMNDDAPATPLDENPEKAVEDTTSGGTVRGLTRLFGGTLKARRATLKESAVTVETPPSTYITSSAASSHSSLAAEPVNIEPTDTRSLHSVQSADSGGVSSWFARRQSQPTKLPVELQLQRDKHQLPPTLSTLSPSEPGPRALAWNRFLTQLSRARAARGSDDEASGLGAIGAAHWGEEGEAGKKKLKRLTELVVCGIPISLRHEVWMELTNTNSLKVPSLYQTLSTQIVPAHELESIDKDVHRTLTSVYGYYNRQGAKRLTKVLTAFVAKYADMGYTQGLNTIAGSILFAVPDEEDAFWLLCCMVEEYFPRGYFSKVQAMRGPLADGVVLRRYIAELIPHVGAHLDELRVRAENTLPLRWFFTAFADVLSQELVLRVWDVWLCLPQQRNFLFQVALAIVVENSGRILACRSEGEYLGLIEGGGLVANEDALITRASQLKKRFDGVEGKRKEALDSLEGYFVS